MPHHPHHHGPHGPHHHGHGPHHHGHGPPHHHRPAPRSAGRSALFAELVVGPLGLLLDIAHEYRDLEELEELMRRRHSTDLKFFESAVAEIKQAGHEPTVKTVLRVMACSKAIDRYQREKASALRYVEGAEGNQLDGQNGGGTHAVILPVPPHLDYIIEEASPGMIFVLSGHHVPHHLDHLEVADLPTRARQVKAVFTSVVSLTFEGVIDRNGIVHTRREICDLLADLADAGIRPSLRVPLMPHLPPHEAFGAVEGDYPVEDL